MKAFLTRITTLSALLLAFAPAAYAGGEGWTDNYDEAKSTAADQDKDLLLDFTGSDWCGWCIKLKEEVFSKDAFKGYADDAFVLVELDFPKNKPQSQEIRQQNTELQEAFAVQGFPTIILADSTGKPYAKTGYQQGGAEAYVEHLKSLKQARVERDEHMSAAKNSDGIEKAKHLHAALQTVGDDLALTHYDEQIDKIIALDADNEAGLKEHYSSLQTAKEHEGMIRQAAELAQNDPKAAVAMIDKLVGMDNASDETRQSALGMKCMIMLQVLQDKEGAKKALQAAIDADPDSSVAAQMKAAMPRMFPEE